MPSLRIMSPEDLIKLAWIPFVTAFIGWLTNWVAIRMLFRPRQPVALFGYKWQGLLPRRQQDVAEKVAELVETELLSQHVIRQELQRLDLKSLLDDFIRRLVREKLGRKLRNVPLLGSQKTLASIEKLAQEAMREEFEGMRAKLADDLEAHLQVRELVKARIEAFEMEQLEKIVQRVAARELRFIEWLGAALGFVVGLFQLAILWAMG